MSNGVQRIWPLAWPRTTSPWGAWGALAFVGALVIVIAALLERHHEWLRDRARQLRTRVASWEY